MIWIIKCEIGKRSVDEQYETKEKQTQKLMFEIQIKFVGKKRYEGNAQAQAKAQVIS